VGREVTPLRLSSDERATIQAAADKERVPLSQLIRYAALALAKQILTPPVREIVVVPPEPEPPREEPHRNRTYTSFADYRANRPFGTGIPAGGSMRSVD